MNIGEVLNDVYDKEIGWRPSSGAIKPVHVANGLARALLNEHYDLTKLHQLVVWWKRGKTTDELRSYEALVHDDPSGLYRSIAHNADAFDRTRRYLEGLLGADKGLFPSIEKSDFTLTSARMASRSGNDRGVGEFGAALLNDGAQQSLSGAFRRSASSDKPQDAISAAVWPLLELTPRESRPSQKAATALERSHNRAVVAALREAAEVLATHEDAQGNRLRTLERVVHFVCVATLVQAHALSANGDLDKRIPLLLAIGGNQKGAVDGASEQCLSLVYDAFEFWLAEMLALRIGKSRLMGDDGDPIVLQSGDGRSARALLRTIGSAAQGHGDPDEDTLDARMADFASAKREFGKDRLESVLGHTLVASYLREFTSGGPRPFLQGLESRTGLIYPHFQGRGPRRLRPSTAVLDMLVRSVVPHGEAVPLNEFLKQLWNRFGFIVGGRRTYDWDDAEALNENGVSIDMSALISNTEAFTDLLVRMGLARRYADNVTFVGQTHGV